MPKKQNQKPQQSSILSAAKAVWDKDWTVWNGRIQAVGGALVISITGLSSFLSSSAFQNVLETLSPPWYVATGIAVLGLISWLAVGNKDA